MPRMTTDPPPRPRSRASSTSAAASRRARPSTARSPTIGAPVATEILARAGFDWLMVDLEHGVTTEADLVGEPPRHRDDPHRGARPPPVGRAAAHRARPRPRGARRDDPAHGHAGPGRARRSRSCATRRTAPAGSRSRPAARASASGRTPTSGRSTRTILGIIQIESPSAVEHAAEIAAIDGVDVLFVGPADLSHSLGVPGQLRRRRATSRRSATSRPSPRPPARRPGSCCTTRPIVAAPSRARLPVHRPRRGWRLRRQRRAGHARAVEPADPTPRGSLVARRAARCPSAGAAPRRPGLGDDDAGQDERRHRRAGRASAPPRRGSPRGRSSRSARPWLMSEACAAPTRRAPA